MSGAPGVAIKTELRCCFSKQRDICGKMQHFIAPVGERVKKKFTFVPRTAVAKGKHDKNNVGVFEGFLQFLPNKMKENTFCITDRQTIILRI